MRERGRGRKEKGEGREGRKEEGEERETSAKWRGVRKCRQAIL